MNIKRLKEFRKNTYIYKEIDNTGSIKYEAGLKRGFGEVDTTILIHLNCKYESDICKVVPREYKKGYVGSYFDVENYLSNKDKISFDDEKEIINYLKDVLLKIFLVGYGREYAFPNTLKKNWKKSKITKLW